MKILQVVPYFYPAWAYGGPAKLVYDTSIYFALQGHNVTVYTSDAFDINKRMPNSKRVEDSQNLHIKYFRNVNNYLSYVYNIFVTPGILFESFKNIKNVDVIHLHDFYTTQNVWICLLARLYQKPYILSVHGCLEEERIAQRSLFKKIFLLLFGKILLNSASSVIATSPNEVEAYKAYGLKSSKIVFFGHGVNAEEFQTKATKEESRKHFKLDKDEIVVTFLGRIHKIKGLNNLVKAIRQIKSSNIHFVIAGSDDGYLSQLKKDLKKYNLSKKITLLGTCFGEEKSKLFKATDIFVYPSYSEGFSLGILEAAAAGLPLIITTGCHFDQVESYKAGLVVESSNYNVLSEAIKKMANNDLVRKKYSKNAKKLISENYSMQVIGNKILDVYKKSTKLNKHKKSLNYLN